MTIKPQLGWQHLDKCMTEAVAREVRAETPDVGVLRTWIGGELLRQTGVDGWNGEDEAERTTLAEWLAFQRTSAVFTTNRRRLRYLLYDSYSAKLSRMAQRHCAHCGALESAETQGPVHTITVRIGPASRQTLGTAEWAAFQAAIRHWFVGKEILLPPGSKYCIALTFILGPRRRNRDLDNMAKAMMDAFSRAVGFNDADVHHLDLMKFIGPYDEEFVTIHIQRSHLESDNDVLRRRAEHSFAVDDPLDLADFLPTNL